MSLAIGHRVAPQIVDPALGRVVLQVHGGQVPARPSAGEPPGELLLGGPLQHDRVDRPVPQPPGRYLDRVGGPVPGAGPAAPVGAAAGRHRQQPGMAPARTRVEPWTCQMSSLIPARRPQPVQRGDHAAALTPAGRMAGDRAVHIPAAPAGGGLVAEQRDRPAVGGPAGRGTIGANSDTTGVPTAAARWATPVLATRMRSAPARTSASSARLVRPLRSDSRPPGCGGRRPRPPRPWR